jgi:hypothetical protein
MGNATTLCKALQKSLHIPRRFRTDNHSQKLKTMKPIDINKYKIRHVLTHVGTLADPATQREINAEFGIAHFMNDGLNLFVLERPQQLRHINEGRLYYANFLNDNVGGTGEYNAAQNPKLLNKRGLLTTAVAVYGSDGETIDLWEYIILPQREFIHYLRTPKQFEK